MVATPGRILDLVEKGVADLSNCNIMVLDEVRTSLSALWKSDGALMLACGRFFCYMGRLFF